MTNKVYRAALLTRGRVFVATVMLGAPMTVQAEQSAKTGSVDYGLVLDGTFSSRGLAQEEERGKGFGLGHTELSARGNVDDRLAASVTAALSSHGGESGIELEEANLETTGLGGGLSLRAGRMLSQIGHLNGQHLHADDFTVRPLIYRGLLGSHYFDDGIRVNWVLPTSLYARIGVELFDGRGYVNDSANDPSLGVWTISAKLGGDIGRHQSWQAGLSALKNRRKPVIEDHDEAPQLILGEEETHEAGDHGHDHAHGARFTGGTVWIADLVWKWAPKRNNRHQQIRLHAELARVTDVTNEVGDSARHEGWTLSAVYRFHPQWELGARYGELKTAAPHEDHFDRGQLSETSIMLAWKRSHFSTLRLSLVNQQNKSGFDASGDAMMLQYVLSLGAHGAHSF